MTLDDVLRDIHAMREDLLMFERKYGVPTEMFYEVYKHGEEPADASWVLDWSEWAASYQILQERLSLFDEPEKSWLIGKADPEIALFFGCLPNFPGRDSQGEYEHRDEL